MERLDFDKSQSYQAIEATIHMNRYLVARQFCKGKKVLDAACGEGYGSFLMAEWGAAFVDGMDISLEAIDKAKRYFSHGKVRYHCQPVENMRQLFEPNSFDVIVSLETFEHLQNPLLYLQEIKYLIKDKGIIIISCPNDYYYYPEPELSNPFHVKKYTLNEFRELSESILGYVSQILIGTPVNGFINIDKTSSLIGHAQDNQIIMLQAKNDVDAVIVPTEEKISEKNCSYFIGIWGTEDKPILNTLTVYPRSMDEWWQALNTENYYHDLKNQIVALEQEKYHLELKLDVFQAENEFIREESRQLKLFKLEKKHIELRMAALLAENEFLKEVTFQLKQNEHNFIKKILESGHNVAYKVYSKVAVLRWTYRIMKKVYKKLRSIAKRILKK